MNAAIRVEALKLSRSPVGMIATVALILGTAVLLIGITAGIAAGKLDMIAQAGAGAWVPLAAPASWAMSDVSALTVTQLLLPVLLTLTFVILICLSGARLQLNR